jgi:hypothetical protein
MTWQRVEITGGVVKTRNDSAIRPGELTACSDLRYKPGDLVQLHFDRSTSSVDPPTGTIVDIFFLSFETINDKLLAVTSVGLEWTDIATISWSTLQAQASITKAAVVHRGDEYFVGTDQGKWTIESDGTIREMGMEARTLTAAFSVVPSVQDNATTSNETQWATGDVIAYWWTEYDSSADIESGPVHGLVEYAKTDVTPNVKIQVQTPWGGGKARLNDHADDVRLYRHFISREPSVNEAQLKALDVKDKIQAGDISFLNGGLLIEMDWNDASYPSNYEDGEDNNDPGVIDPSRYAYPLLLEQLGGSTDLFQQYIEPGNFDVGVLFQDHIVVNKPATDDRLAYYAPAGLPEYQPTPYSVHMNTVTSDELVGLMVIGGVLILLTDGGIHRQTYLPEVGEIAQNRGRAQEVITLRHGCVGRGAYTKLETEAGELVVWLSRQGLRWTNGRGWSDACPDWSVEGAGLTQSTLSSCTLVNNPREHRLELRTQDDPSVRWDFYYHPTLLKNSRLRCLGPTTEDAQIIATTVGRVSGQDVLWTASSAAIYQHGSGWASNTSYTTGQFADGTSPFKSVRIQGVGLTHTSLATTAGSFTITSKLDNNAEQSVPQSVYDLTRDETSKAQLPTFGNWHKVALALTGSEEGSIGPMWIDVEGSGGASGP